MLPRIKTTSIRKMIFESILKEIKLPVILVAYQRKSLDPEQKGGANSFSGACSDILDYLEIGYISAIEIQSPNVEGIVKNNLVDMSEFCNSIGLLIGIDCHEWAVYPNHDSRTSNRALRSSQPSGPFPRLGVCCSQSLPPKPDLEESTASLIHSWKK